MTEEADDAEADARFPANCHGRLSPFISILTATSTLGRRPQQQAGKFIVAHDYLSSKKFFTLSLCDRLLA